MKTYLQRKAELVTRQLLEWPTQNPDLNVVEAEIMCTGRKMEKQPETKTLILGNIAASMEQAPNGITPETEENIPQRISAVWQEKRAHTKKLNFMHQNHIKK